MNENSAYKSDFATLIGRPNIGKSTLMNRLIGQKIAITSNKPQTTRNRIQTVLTLDEGQIVFLDTPGIHSFTAIDSTRTATRASENSTGAGWIIRSTEDLTSSTPISSTRAATTRPERYS